MADDGGFFQPSGCEICGNLSFSSEWFQAFGVVLCNQCKRNEALISKGNSMTQYCLTTKDLQGLGCISKDNPQKKNWSAMKLYLRRQVEERAIQKHGDLDTVHELRHDRIQAKVQGWLAKRARAGSAEAEGGGCEDEGNEDGGRLDGSGAPSGSATRVKLSAAAARVRERLASEYEWGRLTAAGGDAGPTGGANGAGGGEPDGGGDVEMF